MAMRNETVFLLGAGATRGGLNAVASPPPPLDLDFFDIASLLSEPGTYKLARTVLRDVWTLYGKTSGISLERYYRDIETRERIGKFAKGANKPKDWKRRKKDLEELIRRSIIHTTCVVDATPVAPIVSKVHKKIIQSLRAGDTIITFNYDTTIEESFPDTKLWSPVDGYGAKVHNVTNSWVKHWLRKHGGTKKKSKVLILKLHGSINWTLYKNRQIRIKPRPYVLRTRSSSAVFDKIAIIPPSLDKPVHQNPYNKLWRTARLKLDSCRSIVLIGYSLPEADLLARGLFEEVCRWRALRRHYLRNFYVVDPSRATQEKMIEVFGRAIGPDTHVLRHESLAEFEKHYTHASP